MSKINHLVIVLTLCCGQVIGGVIGWQLPSSGIKITPLPKWIKKPSTKAKAEPAYQGWLFKIPEPNRACRWQIKTGPVSLQNYPYLHFSYQACDISHRGGNGNYIIYLSAHSGNGKKEAIYPITGRQLQLSPTITGKTATISINLYKKFKLPGDAVISRVIIGLASERANLPNFISGNWPLPQQLNYRRIKVQTLPPW